MQGSTDKLSSLLESHTEHQSAVSWCNRRTWAWRTSPRKTSPAPGTGTRRGRLASSHHRPSLTGPRPLSHAHWVSGMIKLLMLTHINITPVTSSLGYWADNLGFRNEDGWLSVCTSFICTFWEKFQLLIWTETYSLCFVVDLAWLQGIS